KSALGNLLIGSKVFPEGFTQAGVTREGVMKQRLFGKTTLKVVDTPGFFDPVENPRAITAEIRKSLDLVAPGPHAFLVVIKAGRLSPEERGCPQKITETIGPEALNWCILIITHSDDFVAHDTTFEEYYNSGDRFLPEILIKNHFSGRWTKVNSKEVDTQKNQTFINDLIKQITSMVGKNNGMCFENDSIIRRTRTEPKQETMANIKNLEEDRAIPHTTDSALRRPDSISSTTIQQNIIDPNILGDRHRNSPDTTTQIFVTHPVTLTRGDVTTKIAKHTKRRHRKTMNNCTIL
ncbi:unnamed protein product, partial [Rotaria socialis]